MVYEAESLNWGTPAAQRLDLLARILPREPVLDITVFGSSPLQLFIDAGFLSQDVDLFPDSEDRFVSLQQFVEQQGLGQEQTEFYLQVCDPRAFRSTFDWRSRAIEVRRHGHLFRFVHPWDVLVSKLQRLEEKDLNAFRVVVQKTGHPTEAEFRLHLQKAVDLYRPRFDEERQVGDMLMNTRILWRELWGRDIDPRVEIIRPAIERINRAHSDFDPTLKDRLYEVGRPYRTALTV